MTDKEFKDLQAVIHSRMLALEALQKRHVKETGRRYVIGGPMKAKDSKE